MIAPALADTSCLMSKVFIAQRLLGNVNVFIHLSSQDHHQIMILISDLLQSDLPMSTTYNFISLSLICNIPDFNSTMYSFIEKLTYYIDNIDSNNTCLSLNKVLSLLYQSNRESITSQMEKSHSKLITSTLRILKDEQLIIYALKVLHTLVSSRLQISPSTINNIKVSCMDLISDVSLQGDATSILAAIYSTASSDQWNAQWNQLCYEGLLCVSYLGIDTSSSSSSLSATSVIPSLHDKIHRLAGPDKAQLIRETFSGISDALLDMLRQGNCCAPISIDIALFLRLSSALLPYKPFILSTAAEVSSMRVDNLNHLSPIVLIANLPDMKIQCLDVMSAVIHVCSSSLLKASPTIARTISSALLSSQAIADSILTNKCLQTFTIAITAFPSATLAFAEVGITHVLTLLQELVARITISPTSLLPTDESILLHHINPIHLLDAINAIILSCGHSLSEDLTSAIESSLYNTLIIISKGIFINKQVRNRKIQRVVCELVREDSSMQSKFLEVSLSFILTCHRNGLISGLIPILRRCSEVCSINLVMRSSSIRILSVLDSIIMPTAVVVPVSTLQVAIQEEIRSSRRASTKEEQSSLPGGDEPVEEDTDLTTASGGDDEDVGAKRTTEYALAEKEGSIMADRKRVKSNEQNVDGDDSATRKVEALFTPRAARSEPQRGGAEEDEEDDDDMIPEINV